MEFYREGFLNKAGKGIIQAHLHSWRPRYFVLDGLQLKYYKSKELLPENMLGCIGVSEMECISVMKNESKAFQITTKPRTYYMSGKNEDEVQGWIKCLNMAREKYQKKNGKGKKNSGDESVPSLYDEVNFTPNINPPAKPLRSLIVSGSNFLDSSPPYATQSSPTSKTTSAEQPVFSQYAFIDIPGTNDQPQKKTEKSKEENLYQDPTYDTINEKDVKKKSNNENIDEATNLYDTVSTVTTKKLTSRASDPLPLPIVPPPLPARLASMSSDPIIEEKTPEKNENLQMNLIGLYAEVKTVDNPITTEPEAKEAKSEPLHVYAKPQKSKSMKKKLSKKKIIPGLMDVGEVDNDMEEEAAGGRETLKQGMTKPYGDRFAIEDLCEFLAECDEEDKNNNKHEAEIFVDFEVNQTASAFELLKLFLSKYE